MMLTVDDDVGDELEHADLEAHAPDANIAELSIHQLIARDEACDSMDNDDSGQDGAHNDAMRSMILSGESCHSENTPYPDHSFQNFRSNHRRRMPRDNGFDGEHR